MLSRVKVTLRKWRKNNLRVKRVLRNDPEDKESCFGLKFRYLPYSGTCPVPLFRRRRTRRPPDLISSMALPWVMSRVLSPLISMIWSPTWTSSKCVTDREKQLQTAVRERMWVCAYLVCSGSGLESLCSRLSEPKAASYSDTLDVSRLPPPKYKCKHDSI